MSQTLDASSPNSWNLAPTPNTLLFSWRVKAAEQHDPSKRKADRLPSLDLAAIQPSIKKKAKTNANQFMEGDKELTLADLAAEPAIVPATKTRPGELKSAVVTNGGYALTQLTSGGPLSSFYSLAPEEYKENRWEGVYAKERRRFVLMAQELYGEGSLATDEKKAEGEAKWQEHVVRLLAPPITNRDQIDMVYLRNVSASNPTSLAWVIKIDALVMKLDKSAYCQGKTPQKYVGPSRKPLWPGANAITAIRGMMGYSVPGAIYFDHEACARCVADLAEATSRAALFDKRFEENTRYQSLALPCGQTTALEQGLGEEIVVGTGNCFRCAAFLGCEKNRRDQVVMSHRTLEKLRDGIAYLERTTDPDERHQASKKVGNLINVAAGLPLRSNSSRGDRQKAIIDAGNYSGPNLDLATSTGPNASQEVNDAPGPSIIKQTKGEAKANRQTRKRVAKNAKNKVLAPTSTEE